MAGASLPPRRTPGEERLFSLILALVASPQGLTKGELLESVYGYAGRATTGSAKASIERQFERDKEQIKQLGISIETLDSPQEPGNNQLTRYRVSKDRLQLPADVHFTAEELGMLRLASLAWSEGSLGAESRWAGMKLASLTAGMDVKHLGIAPSLGIPDRAAPALKRAIAESRVVGFDYLLPSRDAPLHRRVAPLRLHRAEGRWHLIAHDLKRGENRVFLLSRITSEVRIESEVFEADLRQSIESTLEQLLGLSESQRATVSARRGSAAEARLAARGVAAPRIDEQHADFTLIEFGTLDFSVLAEELASYGDEVVATSPPKLQHAVVETLRSVRAQHGRGAEHV